MKLKELINPKYLQKEHIINLSQKLNHISKQEPVQYVSLEDFIEPGIFQKMKKYIKITGYETRDSHTHEGSKMHSIILQDPFLSDVYSVFESSEFEKYISLFYHQKLQRSFYALEKLPQNQTGLIAQIYGKSDFLSWHVDGPVGVTVGSFVYYLYNSDIAPSEKTGGVLELGIPRDYENVNGYYKNIDTYKKIYPKENTLMFMITSQNSFHRVSEIKTDMTRMIMHSTLIPISG